MRDFRESAAFLLRLINLGVEEMWHVFSRVLNPRKKNMSVGFIPLEVLVLL